MLLNQRAKGIILAIILLLGSSLYITWVLVVPLLPESSAVAQSVPSPWAALVLPASFYAVIVSISLIVAGFSLLKL